METRKGSFPFTSKIEIQYNPELLKDENFLQKLSAYPQNTCPKQNSKNVVSTPKANSASELTKENSDKLERLEQERAQLEATLSAMQADTCLQLDSINMIIENQM